MAVLRINGSLGRVAAVARALNAIETAYNGLYTFEALTESQQPPEYLLYELMPWSRGVRFSKPSSLRPSTALLKRSDLLVLKEARFASPGFWTVLGALNPLESIRKFLNDEDGRLKDRRYRSRLDEERLEEEVERLRLGNVEKRIQILRELDTPEPIISQMVTSLVVRPLRRLEAAQNAGQISRAESVEPAEPTERERSV